MEKTHHNGRRATSLGTLSASLKRPEDFTVLIPSSDMKKEIMFCGTKVWARLQQIQRVQSPDLRQPESCHADHQIAWAPLRMQNRI